MGEQYAFTFPYRHAYERQNFLLSDSNREALGWIENWQTWPQQRLYLYGPHGSGKSHLCAVWQELIAQSGAMSLTLRPGKSVSATQIPTATRFVVLEDCDAALQTPDDAQNTLHLLNHLQEQRAYVLLTGKGPLSEITIPLADLSSRLNASGAAQLYEPDDTLLRGLIAKDFAQRQIKVEDRVLDYILTHLERSFTAAHWLITQVDQITLAQKRGVTIPLIKDILEAQAATTSAA